MRYALAIVGLSLAGTLNAAALDVRPAGEDEIVLALQGCWNEEWSYEQKRYEERIANHPLLLSIPYSASACFEGEGVISSSWIGGNEGMQGAGKYEVADGKLRLSSTDGAADWWIFGAAELECDVIMRPGLAMKLTNCIGLGEDVGSAIADSSYEFVDD